MNLPQEENKPGNNSEIVQPISGRLPRAGGPRTPAGKQRSKHNALTHGILAKVAVLKNEPRPAFDALLKGFQEYFQPSGTPEEMLVEQLAVLKWRLRRVLDAERAIISNPRIGPGESFYLDTESPLDRPDHLFRYEAGIERSFSRTLDQLERLKRTRLGQPVLPKLEVQHSIAEG